MAIKQGDLVTFKPQWSDPGDEMVTFRAIEDEDGGRVKVLAELGLPLNPTQVVRVEWVATVNGQPLDIDNNPRSESDAVARPNSRSQSGQPLKKRRRCIVSPG